MTNQTIHSGIRGLIRPLMTPLIAAQPVAPYPLPSTGLIRNWQAPVAPTEGASVPTWTDAIVGDTITGAFVKAQVGGVHGLELVSASASAATALSGLTTGTLVLVASRPNVDGTASSASIGGAGGLSLTFAYPNGLVQGGKMGGSTANANRALNYEPICLIVAFDGTISSLYSGTESIGAAVTAGASLAGLMSLATNTSTIYNSILVYDHVLSDTEIAALHDWSAINYGVVPDWKRIATKDFMAGERARLLAYCNQPRAATVYVSAAGNDGGAGTIGDPWLTLAKAQTALNAGNVKVLLNRGDTWLDQWLILAGTQVSVGAYGAGANPLLTRFHGIASWTSAGGGVFTASQATRPGGLTYTPTGGSRRPLFELATVTPVASTDFSWFWDSGSTTLTIRLDGRTPLAGEVAWAPFSNQYGLSPAGNQSYAENIDVEGFGLDESNSYGVQWGPSTDRNAAYFHNVNARYCGTNHATGVSNASGLTGVVAHYSVFDECGVDYSRGGGALFVAFSGPGGQRVHVKNMKIGGSNLVGAAAGGQSVYGHTGGVAKIGLICVDGLIWDATAAHSPRYNFTLGDMPNADSTSYRLARAFVHGEVVSASIPNTGVTTGPGGIIHNGCQYAVSVNGWNAVSSPTTTQYWNTTFLVDAAGSANNTPFSIFTTGTDNSLQLLHCHFQYVNVSHYYCWPVITQSGADNVAASSAAVNSIFAAINPTGGFKIQPGTANTHAGLLNDAFWNVGVSPGEAPTNVSAGGLNTIALAAAPIVGAAPVAALKAAGAVSGLLYDAKWNKRLAAHPSAGPVEAVPPVVITVSAPVIAPTVSVAGLVATLTLHNSGGAITSQTVNWGDGTTDSSLTHTYAGPGVLTIAVSATNAGGTGMGGATANVLVPDLWFNAALANCFTDTAGTVPATLGGAIAYEKAALAGLSDAVQTDASHRPTITSTGIQDTQTGTPQGTALATPLALTGDFTAYLTGYRVSGSRLAPYSAASGTGGMLISTGTDIYCIPDIFTGFLHIATAMTPGAILFRMRRIADAVYCMATGFGSEQTMGTLSATLTIGTMGIFPEDINGANDAANRLMSRLVYARALSVGEMAAVESYLSARDGVSF